MNGNKSFVKKHYENFVRENGYIPEMFNPYNESEITDIAPTQSTQCGSTTILKKEYLETNKSENIICTNLKIRKLTPKECWRLMGFNDENFEKAAKVNSNTQLYKQAGNSIVVDVLVKIFTNLFKEEKKVEEVKIRKYKTDKMIDLNKLLKEEPKLFEELMTDYPVEAGTTLIYEVN